MSDLRGSESRTRKLIYITLWGFCMGELRANSNMTDRIGGQLESMVRVSNVGAKAFEPSTG